MIIQKAAKRGSIAHNVQSQIPFHGAAMFANLLKAVHHQIGGNGKPNAGVIFLRIGKHRFIDADDFPADVDEGTSRIPRKDTGIRLDQVNAGIHQLAFAGADNAAGNRRAQPIGIAACQNNHAGRNFITVAERKGGKRHWVLYLQHGNIQFRVHSHQAHGNAFSIAQRNAQSMLVLNDMISGNNMSFFSNDDAGTQTVNRQPFFNHGITVLGRLRNACHACGVYADQYPFHQPGNA